MNIKCYSITWDTITEEIFSSSIINKIHIIIKVNKFFRQSFYFMYIAFYCISTKCWQVFFRNKIFVINDI